MGLIILGISCALFFDISDTVTNKYANGEKLSAELIITDTLKSEGSEKYIAELQLSSNELKKIYRVENGLNIVQPITLSSKSKEGYYPFYIKVSDSTFGIWKQMAVVSGKDDDLTGKISLKNISKNKFKADVEFESVMFLKIKDVTNATIRYAGVAVEIAIGLIGIMTLWLGVMRIADKSGVINIFARSVRPVTNFLFPDIPKDHPAISAIIMNISANMLGLGNAATPFGIKAMEELDKLNPEKGTATNSMCTFLAINTAGLTLIPTTAIAVRAAAGSADPTIIIGTSIFGAACATFTGITVAKIFEKFSGKSLGVIDFFKQNIKSIEIFLGVVTALVILFSSGILGEIFNNSSLFNADLLKTIIQVISVIAIPLIIFFFLIYGAIKKIKIYEEFVEGAKEGFNVAVKIIPYLVAMLVAIGIFRAGGAMEFLIIILKPITSLIGFPAEALPMALMRPLSGSGSIGIMTEIISVHGPDSYLGVLTSTFLGSTETTLYVLAVYFGAVNIKRTRYAAIAGLLADLAGILAALFIVNLLFG